MFKEITLSINPIFFCNFDCDFCYLTKDQLNDQTLLDLSLLEEKIKEVCEYSVVSCIDLYGGEIGTLKDEYLLELLDICKRYSKDINLITNLSILKTAFKDESITLSVSWEGNIRRKSEAVFQNMQDIGREIHLLMLAGPEMLSWSDHYLSRVIEKINMNKNITSVEVKPYSVNQANQYDIKYTEFEEHIKKWFSFEKEFLFVNEENLKSINHGTRNSFSDDHVYIGPDAKFAVVEFDDQDKEFFMKLNNYSDYIAWANNEKAKVSNNSFCSRCPYLGRCLSEHLRTVKDIKNSCNGFYNLIEWYHKERNEKA